MHAKLPHDPRPWLALGLTLAGLLSAATASAADAAQAAAVTRTAARTVLITGTPAADQLALRRAGERLQVDVGDDGQVDSSLRMSASDRLVVLAGDGDDRVRLDHGGGALSDRIRVEGGAGQDVVDVAGSEAAERFEVAADGRRVTLLRNVADVSIDLGGVERLDVRALGGADRLGAADLSGTELQELHADLAPAAGGDAGDGAGDRVVLDGTPEEEQVSVLGSASDVAVIGLPAAVFVAQGEPGDALELRGRGGDDLLSASTPAGAPRMTLAGGGGSDVLLGGEGNDFLVGGGGFDDVNGRRGDDLALLGDAPDRFTWNPGDGNDRVEGGTGNDSLSFNGAAADETFRLTADGGRLRFERDVASVALELDDVEEINPIAFGGADTFAIGDLSGTDVEQVNPNLTPAFGSPAGDGAADRVALTGTAGDDAVTVTGSGGAVAVAGLPARIGITHAEGALDVLAIDTLGGADSVDSSGLAPGTIGLELGE